ncbi:MAG: shikimate kinase [Bacteroidota bacterium]|nr:shikimate kinase [Bacteroidota bacterium]
MIIYLVGIGCVGKTTIGRMLADNIGFSFYDLDHEVQNYYNKSIERIQDECLTMRHFLQKASKVLDFLFKKTDNLVIAGTPSSMQYPYLDIYKKYKKGKEILSICITDKPENILKRLTFYDIDSNLLETDLTEKEKEKYINIIIGDIDYFNKSYSKVDIQLSIENVPIHHIPNLITKALDKIDINILPAANLL